MFEGGAGLFVEHAVAIITHTSLKHSIAVVANHRLATTAWGINAVTPVSLSRFAARHSEVIY